MSMGSSGRLHLILQATPEEVFEPDSVADAPLVRFIAYGLQERVFGWVRLRADRLTDLLNAYEELHLADVAIESFEDGVTQVADEVTIHRRDLVAVHTTGPGRIRLPSSRATTSSEGTSTPIREPIRLRASPAARRWSR
jgi:hypothetical protein